jgi:hypothetical protein
MHVIWLVTCRGIKTFLFMLGAIWGEYNLYVWYIYIYTCILFHNIVVNFDTPDILWDGHRYPNAISEWLRWRLECHPSISHHPSAPDLTKSWSHTSPGGQHQVVVAMPARPPVNMGMCAAGCCGRSGVENGWWFVICCGLQPLNVTRNIPYITGVKLNIPFINGTALPSMDGYTDSPATIQYLDGFHCGFNTAHCISTWKQRIKPMTSLGQTDKQWGGLQPS